ncbi:hypothetical protein M422DRAFT_254596 [Sphaerobolus stellatus SS14]|uniref:Unplaced genomic scaffold SPHSTscaffold_56, whole genome shotgun sequence n=1 Tax=Sphaerobolus stellatus (strain SS14) TaxID=990650 RepID=A0A0C9VUF4_SPHS4|nr:hypothetical protein M422DRAFT_254596 [Sphaerobolus stellatus SS14]
MSEYSSIQQMERQAVQSASHEEEPEKSFLAKAGVKMGHPPTYSGEHNLEKFENWVARFNCNSWVSVLLMKLKNGSTIR